MFVQVTRLCHWKSEHTKETCQDAVGWDCQQGLFAIADGVSTAILSDLWASILIEHFLKVPLLRQDPFEVAWWLSGAQEQFKAMAPRFDTLPWNVQRKVYNQGSYSTLATLRITDIGMGYARAELLAFGDSCIFIARKRPRTVVSFPLQHASDFTLAPISLPSHFGSFRRDLHHCARYIVALQPGDVIIIATDAVAHWIMNDSGNEGKDDQRTTVFFKKINTLRKESPDTWGDFITKLREQREIIDDDSTALVITLKRRLYNIRPEKANTYKKLGTTQVHTQDIIAMRKRAYQDAVERRDSALQALIIGDATDLRKEGIPLLDEEVWHVRRVADALNTVLITLRQAVNKPDPLVCLQPTWDTYSDILQDEPCAETLRNTLRSLGVKIYHSNLPVM